MSSRDDRPEALLQVAAAGGLQAWIARLDADPQRWFEGADKVPGSWWPAWYAWLAPHAGPQVAARRKPGNAQYQPIEEAPGEYVREKAS